jgi:hypothetical protein
MRPACLLIPLAIATACACGSSQQSIDASWSTEPEEQNRPLRETETLEQGNAPSPLVQDKPEPSWLGVRPDVMIAPAAPHEANCNCLAVRVGSAKDSSFRWQNTVPHVGADARVIAVSARGVACSDEDAKGRPSISAVDRDGSDVIVEIEDLPEGRPIASGAIIPAPAPGGAVYVRPRSRNVAYARGAAGGRCKVE